MAGDHDKEGEGEETAGNPAARPASSPLVRVQAASVESSLDAFIARAKEKPVDVTGFDADKREQALRLELEAVEAKLVAAEARSRRGTGRTIAAFILGCAITFAVGSLVWRSDKPAQPSVAREPAPTITPIAQPTAPPPSPIEPVALPPAPPVEPIAAPEQTAVQSAESTDRAAGRAPKRTTIKHAAAPAKTAGPSNSVTEPATETKPAKEDGFVDPFR